MRPWIVAVALAACGGSPPPSPTPSPGPPTTPSTPITPSTTAPAPTSTADAPEVSHSVGVDGGVVVLWPRLSGLKDAAAKQLAGQIQQRLVAVVGRAAPGKPVDTRPDPERVCPRQGCKAISVGAALLRSGSGCAVVALVSAGGPSEATILPWVGDMTLERSTVAFREAPESKIHVSDYATCASLPSGLAHHDADVEAAIKRLVR